MMPFLLRREEERQVTAKKLKQAESLEINNMWVLQAYLPTTQDDKLCFMMLSTPDSQRGARSLSVKPLSFLLGNAWPTHKPQLNCFAATFSHVFTRILAYTSYDIITCVQLDDERLPLPEASDIIVYKLQKLTDNQLRSIKDWVHSFWWQNLNYLYAKWTSLK